MVIPGVLKTNCCLKLAVPTAPLQPVYDISAQHPSLYAAIEDLMLYERWVSRVVLPIAFQWIEEHKEDVYKSVPNDMRDDVGVAIAAAYNIVKSSPTCRRDRGDRLQNPVWTRIAQKIHDQTRQAFTAEKDFLNDTSCLPAQK